MEKKDILDLKRRREIYEFISKNPGLHMRDLSRKMNIPLTSLEYHLRYLGKRQLIISRADSKYNRYYISLQVSEKEKKILDFFRKETTLQIILWFLIAVQCSQNDISRFLEKHPTTISFHLRRMKNAGIIEEIYIKDGYILRETLPSKIKRPRVSSEKIYILKDHWMIYDLLIKHRQDIESKDIVESIINYVEFYISDGVPKQIQSREETIGSVVEVFNGFFFPPSFCS